jgi:type II secretory pathway component PulJ|tara:strand:- start:377 stop:949 length:573 start_codon:yes stop_codon:yes gene_type:complete
MKSGFTIIEILVALLSVTLISLFSYQYLSNTSLVKDRLEQFISEDTKTNNAINFMRIDLIQSIYFFMKDRNGRPLDSVFIGDQSNNSMMFVSMNGDSFDSRFSNLRRVKYVVEENKLLRVTALANKEDKVLSKTVLLENLDYLKFSYSDDLSIFVNEWQSVQKNNTFPKFIIVEYSINDEIYKYTLSTFK